MYRLFFIGKLGWNRQKKLKKKKKAKAKQHPKAELSLFEILLSSSRYHPKVSDFLKNVQNTSESVYWGYMIMDADTGILKVVN